MYGQELLTQSEKNQIAEAVETIKKIGNKNAERYNGWENRETWALSLGVSNWQSLYEDILGIAQRNWERNKKNIHVGMVSSTANEIKSYLENDVLGYDNISAWNERLIREGSKDVEYDNKPWVIRQEVGSLWRVDYRAIAEHYLEIAKEITERENGI